MSCVFVPAKRGLLNLNFPLSRRLEMGLSSGPEVSGDIPLFFACDDTF